jgi:hypothetical protein
VLVHDQNGAATAAEQFAQVAFVTKDTNAAHALLEPQTGRSLPLASFSEAIAKMHPGGFPNSVKAEAYEPLPGQAGMNVFLLGQNANETFYYRFLMVGDKVSGYKVAYLGRGNGPHPSANKRPL